MISWIDGPITELTLVNLRSATDQYAAQILDAKMRVLEQQWRRSFVEKGLIAVEMKQRQLWKHVLDPQGQPFKSMEAWICNAAPQSRSDCFAAMRAVEELRDIPREQLAEIPRVNIATLRQLSTAVRSDPAVLEAARNLSEHEFTAKIEAEFPSQHVEARKPIKLRPTTSQSLVVERAIQRAIELGAHDREEGLEVVAWFYLESNREFKGE